MRLHVSTAEGTGSIPGRGIKDSTCHTAQPKKGRSLLKNNQCRREGGGRRGLCTEALAGALGCPGEAGAETAGPGEWLFQGLLWGRSEGEARPTGARRRRSQEGSAYVCMEPRGIKDKGPETTGEVITSPGHSASALTLLPGRPSGTALLTGNLGE